MLTLKIPHPYKSKIKYLYFNFFSKFHKSFSARENSVLLIEFNSFHGETLPGYIKYLLDLGYNIDVVLQRSKNTTKGDRNDQGLFSCFSKNNKVKIIFLSRYDMHSLLHSQVMSDFRHIIINTFNDKIEREYFFGLPQLKLVCVIHNPDIIDIYFETHKMISLVKMVSASKNSPPVVNPHYFGEFKKKSRKNDESNKTIFAALNSNDLSQRNFNLLFHACDILYKKGIYNFTVKAIGKGIHIPERYSYNIQDFGFLDFQQMYSEIDTADFFLALIDQKSVHYTNKASGSYQISYGFLKPLILHRQFSDIVGINNKNSVLHNDNFDLADAMEKCINMPNNDYCQMLDALENSERELYDRSLNNLREVLREF